MTVITVSKLKTPPFKLLAIDPGKDTGWCTFRQGNIENFGICRGLDELVEFLQQQEDDPIGHIVMEDFKLFSHKAKQQSGSQLEVVQAIGMVKLWAKQQNIEITLQRSVDALKMGKVWSNVPMPKNHKNSHGISALYHGVYWLVKNEMRLPNATWSG